ncbi:phage tail assembly protein [Methanosarcina sp. Mfa9]|uniref:phage tail assembly protein n=1 Tax=Methanosarcina sp. Mfa9 TaxID=3439063 RepID=UPI003F8405B1
MDEEGNLHKKGTIRLSTAADEILPLRDPKVQANPAYLTVILLSRVITKLGTLEIINTKTIENFFVSDLAYLQDFYTKINETGTTRLKTVCPNCGHQFEFEEEFQGE